MALTTGQIATLHTELLTDPAGLGYAPHVAAGATVNLATILNTPGPPNATQFTSALGGSQIVSCLVAAEYATLSALNRELLSTVMAAVPIDASSATTRTLMASIFSLGTITRTNLIAAASRPGSRAEVLFGATVSVTSDDVAKALV